MKLIESVKKYGPMNEQERLDKIIILDHLLNTEDVFTRDNQTAHMTASAWVVNKTRDKVLMIYHNIYNSWSWLGGHADGDTDLLHVALKEVEEESGLTEIHPLSEDIFSLETLTVDGHERRGTYVPSHLHLNITYLIEADENETLKIKPDENSDISWFSLEEAIQASTEPWFKERIYKKLNEKLSRMI